MQALGEKKTVQLSCHLYLRPMFTWFYLRLTPRGNLTLHSVNLKFGLRLDPKDKCFRLDSMNLTSDYVQWTLLESSLDEIYLRLDSKELHWRLVSIWLQTVSTELYLRLDPKDRCFRLDSMKLTSDYVQWTLLESSLHDIYLRLDSKELHWRLVSIWLQTVSTELYLRLDPKDRCFRLDSMKLTSDYVQWTLLESSLHDIYLGLDSKELYLRMHPLKFT